MPGAIDIQRRIKSIKNTKKVTKAMEVVSAAKMKKAVGNVLALRPYAVALQSAYENVTTGASTEHPLLAERDVKKILIIVVASNKGLCGSFNALVGRTVRKIMAEPENLVRSRHAGAHKKSASKNTGEDLEIDFVSVGKKADVICKSVGKSPVASFPDLNYDPDSAMVSPLVSMIFDQYADGTYDKVAIVYTDYVNVIVQEQKIRQMLPVSHDDLSEQVMEMGELANGASFKQNKNDYIVEPSREDAFTALIPRVLESQILHAIYESNASKESSRMIAMKNATDAAGDIIDDLTLAYNKMRQAKITQEISEISAGRAALE